MQQEIKNGGLNIINLEWMIDALKINWINRLQEENSLIRKLLDTMLGTVSFLDLCRGEITDDIIEKLPAFYVDILKSLKKIMKYSIPESAEEIQYEMLWFNTYINVNGKPLFYESWYKKGLLYIHQLVDINGNFVDKDTTLEEQFQLEIAQSEQDVSPFCKESDMT